MYRIGYIDDDVSQFKNFSRKINRLFPEEMELVLLDQCETKEEFLDKILETRSDVLLVDYKMSSTFGFQGTTLIHFINNHIKDLECFILTGVDSAQIDDGLVSSRNIQSKSIFDTEGGDPERMADLNAFLNMLKESAEVFRTRKEQDISRYKELSALREKGELGTDEDEYLNLYKVLSSYGMLEKLPERFLRSKFDKSLDELLNIGNIIIESHVNG